MSSREAYVSSVTVSSINLWPSETLMTSLTSITRIYRPFSSIHLLTRGIAKVRYRRLRCLFLIILFYTFCTMKVGKCFLIRKLSICRFNQHFPNTVTLNISVTKYFSDCFTVPIMKGYLEKVLKYMVSQPVQSLRFRVTAFYECIQSQITQFSAYLLLSRP